MADQQDEDKPEIPGYYYDRVKKKYFKIQANSFNPAGSVYSTEALQQQSEDQQLCNRKKQIEKRNKSQKFNLLKRLRKHQLGGVNLAQDVQNHAIRYFKEPLLLDSDSHSRIGEVACSLLASDDMYCLLDSKLHNRFKKLDLRAPEQNCCVSYCYGTHQMAHSRETKHFQLKGNLVELAPGCILSSPTETIHNLGPIDIFQLSAEYGDYPYKPTTVYTGKNFFSMIKCPNSSSMIYASYRHRLAKHDLFSSNMEVLYEFPFRVSGPCIASQDANTVYVGSRRRGVLFSIDCRDKRWTILSSSEKHPNFDEGITSLATLGNEYCLCIGFQNSKVSLFDIRMNRYIASGYNCSTTYPFGMQPVKTDETGSFILRANRKGDILVWDSRNLENVALLHEDPLVHCDITTKYGLPMILSISNGQTKLRRTFV